MGPARHADRRRLHSCMTLPGLAPPGPCPFLSAAHESRSQAGGAAPRQPALSQKGGWTITSGPCAAPAAPLLALVASERRLWGTVCAAGECGQRDDRLCQRRRVGGRRRQQRGGAAARAPPRGRCTQQRAHLLPSGKGQLGRARPAFWARALGAGGPPTAHPQPPRVPLAGGCRRAATAVGACTPPDGRSGSRVGGVGRGRAWAGAAGGAWPCTQC